MPKATKATDPSAPKKTSRTKKPVATASQAVATPEAFSENTSVMSVEEQVRQRAYEIYQQRGGTGGTAQEDWLQAETEILGKRTA